MFIIHTIQSRVTALHTIQEQLHSRTNFSSSNYSHHSLHVLQKYRKPVLLSGPAFTLIHVLISSDMSIQFILPLKRRLLQKRFFRHTSAIQVLPVWALSYGCKFIGLPALLLLPEVEWLIEYIFECMS